MIQKLRKRFLTIIFLVLSVVLIGVLTAVYVLMYRSEVSQSEKSMQEALKAVDRPDASVEETIQPGSLRSMIAVFLSSEFSITAVQYGMENVNYDAQMPLLMEMAFATNEKTGKLSYEDLDFRYMYQKTAEGYHLVLLDRAVEMNTMHRLLRTFLIICGTGLLVIFGISLFLSRWVTRPISIAWENQRLFVSDASHELKTPLTVIATNADVVLSNPDATISSQEKWLGYIKEETTRMAKLVKDLLYIAKTDANEIKLDKKPLDFSELVEGVCLNYEGTAFELEKRMRYQIASKVMVVGDAVQLAQMISILLDNALMYSETHGEIDLRLLRDRHARACLMVSNTGDGIPPESLDKVFERFYRVDSSRARNTGGYGLGLNIAKSIAEMHEGTITVSSVTAEPTIFTVLLP